MQRLLLLLVTMTIVVPAGFASPTDDPYRECVTGLVAGCVSGASVCSWSVSCCPSWDPFEFWCAAGPVGFAFGVAVVTYSPPVIRLLPSADSFYPGEQHLTVANADVDVTGFVIGSAQALDAEANQGAFPASLPPGAGVYAMAAIGRLHLQVGFDTLDVEGLSSGATYDTGSGAFTVDSLNANVELNGVALATLGSSPNATTFLGSSITCGGAPVATLVFNEQATTSQGGQRVAALHVSILDQTTCTPGLDLWLAGSSVKP